MSQTIENPFNVLIEECSNQPKQIEERYKAHRIKRTADKKAFLLSKSFPGPTIDPILAKLDGPNKDVSFVDPRNCLVFWARPPQNIRSLVEQIQGQLLEIAPKLWIMPGPNLHMTVLEVTHSKTPDEISAIVETMKESVQTIADYTFDHRTSLHKPLLSFDEQGVALTFLPKPYVNRDAPADADASFTYHHLRRDVCDLVTKAGAEVNCRYMWPSSHITVARFIESSDFMDANGKVNSKQMTRWVDRIEEINVYLESPEISGVDFLKLGGMGEWVIGEEKGLDHRKGSLWYGGGETICLGKGSASL